MIIANGQRYITLDDRIEVNGRRVVEVYANGKLAYPEAPRKLSYAGIVYFRSAPLTDSDDRTRDWFCTGVSGTGTPSEHYCVAWLPDQSGATFRVHQNPSHTTYAYAFYNAMDNAGNHYTLTNYAVNVRSGKPTLEVPNQSTPHAIALNETISGLGYRNSYGAFNANASYEFYSASMPRRLLAKYTPSTGMVNEPSNKDTPFYAVFDVF